MSETWSVDLNSDVGESFGRWVLGDDDAVLDLVTSANVACGFHAGDPSTLRQVCADAVTRGVRIGAQVGYRDLAGFGRRFVDVAPGDLAADVLYQLGALDAFARVAGDRVRYLKPHGALWHATIGHEAQAAAVVEAVVAYDDGLPVLGPDGSALLDAAGRAGLRTVREAFADRGYTADGRLVPRGQEDAVLSDDRTVGARAVQMVRAGSVEAVDGGQAAVRFESLCVHGDSPGAVATARSVRAALGDAGIDVRPFT